MSTALLVAGLVAVAGPHGPASADHEPLSFSQGVYRIPYADGTEVRVTRDHHDHAGLDNSGAKDRIDMVGDDGASSYTIVAAASGYIRWIEDSHGGPDEDPDVHSCQDDADVPGDCTDYNNFVWIEHPNGEWTKYSHLDTGSASANWEVDEWIDAGDALGTESDIGFASGPHLHWEVGIPNNPGDPTPFSVPGGFIQGQNRSPLICDIPNNLYVSQTTYTANPCSHQPPTADAGGPYLVDEGSTVLADGAGSSDPEGNVLTYVWEPADKLDDPSLAQPTYTAVDDAVDVLTLTVYDQIEALPDSDSTTVTVNNVAPTVSAVGDSIGEAGSATVSATVNDPGAQDTHTAAIDWGDGTPSQPVSVGQLAAGASHVYGDNGTFDVTVTVTDDDGGLGADVATVVVGNLDPSASLDHGDAVSFPGGDYLVTGSGAELPAAAEGTDPGSDDLTFTWSVGDETTYFNNGVGPDPFPSPFGTFPFQASDAIEAVYAVAGVEELTVTLTDDDGGAAADDAGVLVAGNADDTRGSGWWKHQYSGTGNPHIDSATAEGYLEIVNAVSSVFSEATAATTSAEAHQVLSPTGSDQRARAEAELMVAWLQFASGAVPWDATVPLKGGTSVGFLDLMFTAEEAILAANTSDAELHAIELDLAQVRHAG